MTRSFLPALMAGVSFAAVLPAQAADIAPPSRIEAVTVFPDGATVTRRASVQLPAGASVLVFKGLSPLVDPASIRVAGEGGAALSIGSVDVRTVPGEARPSSNPELEGRIDALKRQRALLQGQIEAAEGKKAAIQAFARPPETPAGGTPLPVDQWGAAWDAIGGALDKAGQALAGLREQDRKLEADIEALVAARPRATPPGAPRRDVAVGVETTEPFEGTIEISYRTGGANWQPVYDVRLDTGARDRKPSLEIVRRAVVSQKTGEDWSDVALTVSTVRTAGGTAAPEPNTLVLNLWDPELAARRVAPAPMAAPVIAAAPANEVAAAAEVRRKVAVEETARVESAPFQSAFKVPGKVTLAGDGTKRNLLLSARKAEAALQVKASPGLEETAYLETSFVNDEEAALLPGEVNLQRDGMFVGRARFALVPPGDKTDLGFGADDRVKVTRAPVRRKETEPGWTSSTRTDTREFRTVVRNLHDVPVKITVLDQVPVSENASITVDLLPTTTAATEKQVGDKRGVMSWTWDYQPGEQKEVRLGYRVKWPADRELSYGGVPSPYRR